MEEMPSQVHFHRAGDEGRVGAERQYIDGYQGETYKIYASKLELKTL